MLIPDDGNSSDDGNTTDNAFGEATINNTVGNQQQQQISNLFHKRYPFFSSTTKDNPEFALNDRASKRPRLVSYNGDSFSIYRGEIDELDEDDGCEDEAMNDDQEEEMVPFPEKENVCTRKDQGVDTMIHDLEERLERLTSYADYKREGWSVTNLKSWRKELRTAVTEQNVEEEGNVCMDSKKKKKQYQQPWLKKQAGHDTVVRQRRKEARRHLIRLMKRNDETGIKR